VERLHKPTSAQAIRFTRSTMWAMALRCPTARATSPSIVVHRWPRANRGGSIVTAWSSGRSLNLHLFPSLPLRGFDCTARHTVIGTLLPKLARRLLASAAFHGRARSGQEPVLTDKYRRSWVLTAAPPFSPQSMVDSIPPPAGGLKRAAR